MELSQTAYLEAALAKFGIGKADVSRCVTPCADGAASVLQELSPTAVQDPKVYNKYPYQKLIGTMSHAVQWTRPDCATVQSLLARHQINYTVSHWKAAKRMLMYLRNTKAQMRSFLCRQAV